MRTPPLNGPSGNYRLILMVRATNLQIQTLAKTVATNLISLSRFLPSGLPNLSIDTKRGLDRSQKRRPRRYKRRLRERCEVCGSCFPYFLPPHEGESKENMIHILRIVLSIAVCTFVVYVFVIGLIHVLYRWTNSAIRWVETWKD